MLNTSESVKWIRANDGHEIYTRTYRPIHRSILATVVLVHGFGEHCDRYSKLARRFTDAGIQVYTYDQRGFGKTGRQNGRPGHTGGFQNLIDDLSFICSRAYQSEIPTIIFGHAMGAVVALDYAKSSMARLPIAGVIAQAPAIRTNTDLHPNRVAVSLGHLAAKIVKSKTIDLPIEPEMLTRDQQVVAEFKASDYNYEIGSLQTVSDLLKRGPMLLDTCHTLTDCPVLITHGDEDQITPYQGSRELFEKLPFDIDKELKIYRGCFHELHHEPVKDEIIAYYIEWALKRADMALLKQDLASSTHTGIRNSSTSFRPISPSLL
ncbi:Alpha/Beta hydrolase protein [Dimargaris cristalligena]|uniref:Alpha/Beta hydrolase protein n=1 Tax=Dimargaris cristalligena TaxID=215637 RepID=A0A4P9ZV93_9FUNG|nr:Alpha/Beta hydrolase protein [Dimargaris cristalligena]|eukprot:RKP37497.1 Alpha/Beta hydrolase protein [Dimargaris cristalligena]